MDEVLVELDSRQRVSLAKLGLAPHSRYLVSKEPEGRLIFTPAAVVPETPVSRRTPYSRSGSRPTAETRLGWSLASVSELSCDIGSASLA